MNSKDTSDKLVGALVSGLAILRYLQKSQFPVGMTKVARDLKLNPSTCYNLLRTLVHERLANFDPATKTYSLSLGVVSLAQGAIDKEHHVRIIRPEIQRIASQFSVATALWFRSSEDRVLLVDRAESTSDVQISMRIGQRLPEFVGALGRCFAAYSSLSQDEIRSRFSKIRFKRPLNFDEWWSQVELVKKESFAVDDGYFSEGIITVAVPVFGNGETLRMAVSAIAIAAQMDAATLRALISEMLKLSNALPSDQ